MPVPSRGSFALVAATFVNVVALGIMAFGVSAIWGQAKDIGKIEVTTDQLKLGFEGLSRKLDMVQSSLDLLGARVKEAEIDISPLLTKLGLPKADIAATWIGNDIVFFPKTMGARERFIKSGYQQIDVNPVLYGFRAPPTEHKSR